MLYFFVFDWIFRFPLGRSSPCAGENGTDESAIERHAMAAIHSHPNDDGNSALGTRALCAPSDLVYIISARLQSHRTKKKNPQLAFLSTTYYVVELA